MEYVARSWRRRVLYLSGKATEAEAGTLPPHMSLGSPANRSARLCRGYACQYGRSSEGTSQVLVSSDSECWRRMEMQEGGQHCPRGPEWLQLTLLTGIRELITARKPGGICMRALYSAAERRAIYNSLAREDRLRKESRGVSVSVCMHTCVCPCMCV